MGAAASPRLIAPSVNPAQPYAYQIDGRPFRVLFCSADTFGCGFYRCFMPSYFLTDCRLAESRIDGKAGQIGLVNIDWADLVVFQRIRAAESTAIIYATKRNKRIVMENDDWYSKIPTGSHAKRFFSQADIAGLHRSMQIADGLTVTTEVLRKEYSQYCGKIAAIPNALDPAHVDHNYPMPLPWNNNGKKEIVIGYQGSVTHSVDFASAEAALIDIMAKYPFVRINAVGYLPDKICQRFKSRIFLHPWVPLHEYYATLRAMGAHFMIAPIVDVPFNRAKSALKITEYGFLRTPWVASRVDPYIEITERSGGGILVKNRYGDWYKALDKMVNMDYFSLKEMGEKARTYCAEHYDIKNVAKQWAEFLYQVAIGPANPKRVKMAAKYKEKIEADMVCFDQIV